MFDCPWFFFAGFGDGVEAAFGVLAGGEFELDGGVFAPVAFDFVLFGYAVVGDDGVVGGVGAAVDGAEVAAGQVVGCAFV